MQPTVAARQERIKPAERAPPKYRPVPASPQSGSTKQTERKSFVRGADT